MAKKNEERAIRLLVKQGRTWKMGIVEYKSKAEAEARQKELKKIGITSKLVHENDIFGGKNRVDWSKGLLATRV